MFWFEKILSLLEAFQSHFGMICDGTVFFLIFSNCAHGKDPFLNKGKSLEEMTLKSNKEIHNLSTVYACFPVFSREFNVI